MSLSKIEKPYNLDGDDRRVIMANFNGKNHKIWDDGDLFGTMKEKIIAHLRKEQLNRCCYCKKELSYDKKGVDIEHIIPKSKRPFYTFLNYNLALSCPACNTTKHFDLPIKKSRKTFPIQSSDYYIVHPHFDYYFKHFQIVKSIFIRPLTNKGRWTFYSCELYSIKKAQDKILDLKLKKNGILELLLQLSLNPLYPNLQANILQLIDDIKTKKFIIQ